jgi:hypothetical protein
MREMSRSRICGKKKAARGRLVSSGRNAYSFTVVR